MYMSQLAPSHKHLFKSSYYFTVESALNYLFTVRFIFFPLPSVHSHFGFGVALLTGVSCISMASPSGPSSSAQTVAKTEELQQYTAHGSAKTYNKQQWLFILRVHTVRYEPTTCP